MKQHEYYYVARDDYQNDLFKTVDFEKAIVFLRGVFHRGDSCEIVKIPFEESDETQGSISE